VAFIALCKGYLGIVPHFKLWRYFFSVSLHKKRERRGDLLVLMGCASIHLRGHRSAKYMALQLSRSNKGWHALWLYMKNDIASPLLDFTGCLIEEMPPVWGWGPPEKEKKRLCDLLDAIALLKRNGLHRPVSSGRITRGG
jgi:hypothetical protein